ncbi:hypothetical protein HN512_03565 [Candidatus Peregrinibacteria bacterium]|jgi:hypothetical protein|nr:hypothetical protein [Candidatus Peregrinibacteria bacterium]MBT3598891.1 hypothetical protein [Candidatus Peregrinibacteria bacterium]MBT4367326.1 hypothetical protein [Candidatus Peregrinibacteria bacterium]MBT4585779.1 hypothetical protein [Candidatus Peregrinibacteria bacterium]MBT6730712.1 hypothetical protein [Candidatus Peregrinibacteria bacterium]
MVPIFSLAGIAAAFVIYVWWKLSSRKLNKRDSKRIRALWAALKHLNDPAMRVMQAEIIFCKALESAGYKGTMAEKLKKSGSRFPNEEALWKAHKLRNRIAHETGITVSGRDSANAMNAFWNGIEQLL